MLNPRPQPRLHLPVPSGALGRRVPPPPTSKGHKVCTPRTGKRLTLVSPERTTVSPLLTVNRSQEAGSILLPTSQLRNKAERCQPALVRGRPGAEPAGPLLPSLCPRPPGSAPEGQGRAACPSSARDAVPGPTRTLGTESAGPAHTCLSSNLCSAGDTLEGARPERSLIQRKS